MTDQPRDAEWPTAANALGAFIGHVAGLNAYLCDLEGGRVPEPRELRGFITIGQLMIKRAADKIRTPAPATLAEDEAQVAAIEAVATALDKATENALASHGRFDTREMARVAIAAYQPFMTGATEKWIARMKGLVESARDMEPVGNILAANEALDRLEELKVLKPRQPAPTRGQVAQWLFDNFPHDPNAKVTAPYWGKKADAIMALWEK